jgi:hypothetical protein
MLIKLFLVSLLVGFLIALFQFRSRGKVRSLPWRLVTLLMACFLLALLIGYGLYGSEQIDIQGYYLYLISTITSIGLFMTFERPMKKSWLTVIAVMIAAAVICFLLMKYKSKTALSGVIPVAIAPGIGYLIYGIMGKYWRPNS